MTYGVGWFESHSFKEKEMLHEGKKLRDVKRKGIPRFLGY